MANIGIIIDICDLAVFPLLYMYSLYWDIKILIDDMPILYTVYSSVPGQKPEIHIRRFATSSN